MTKAERGIATLIENAEEVPPPKKPRLEIQGHDLPATARELRDLLSAGGSLFDRGGPVKLRQQVGAEDHVAVPLTVNNVVFEAHDLCQPFRHVQYVGWVETTLPARIASMYLEMVGDWNLRPLTGVTSAPLLTADGSILAWNGYHTETGLWCAKVPPLEIPNCPTRLEAEAALRILRQAFRTFPFADSARIRDQECGVPVIDLSVPPGRAESAFLTGLLTAACRPSLWVAPGLMVIAPSVSGAGSGKGLLVRSISAIAFGIRPRAFTAGGERHELDKRLAAELVEANQVLFLDNVNGASLNSDLLASVLTERPARVRVLGETRMVMLNSTAFVAVTGNGLQPSLDLARRFIVCELDAQCEDPEARPFPTGFVGTIENRRAELLTAVLTIWRWGRQNASSLTRGKPLGSYEHWCEWVRDPLLTLGCCDPVEQIAAVKASDPNRQRIAELFQIWEECHHAKPVKFKDLDQRVRDVVDPQKRGQNYLVAYIGRLVGTRVAGRVLKRQGAAGKWGSATYSLEPTDSAALEGPGHRDHRDHGGSQGSQPAPVPPMTPMPNDVQTAIASPVAHSLPTPQAEEGWSLEI